MEVTIVMPFFNAERFLADSILSLLSQTCENWKLICIDDGSTDKSRSIVEEFCKRDARIRLISQTNAGPAVARARAIELVDTEYVAILDSDDAYAPDYIEKMLRRAKETDADSIVPNVEFCEGTTELSNMFEQNHLSPDMIIYDGKTAFAMTIPWKLHGWQMVRTSLAKEYYTIQQASYSKFNSDEYITRLLYLKSDRVALCSAIYKYRMDPSSITRKPSLKMMDYLETNAKLLWLAEYEKLDDEVIISIYNNYYATCKEMRIKLIPALSKSEQSIANRLFRESTIKFKETFKWKYLKNAPLRTKVKFFIFLLGVHKSLIGGARKCKNDLLTYYRSLKVENKNITIISNNCWGGFMYQSCKLLYSSPFIGLYMYAPDYIKLLKNLRKNLQKPIHFISAEQSKYNGIINPKYLIGVLGDTDIEIVFMHYHLKEEVLEKWNRRLMRINWNNMLVKFSDTDLCSDTLIEDFDKLPYKHKVCFTAKDYPECDCVISMKEFQQHSHVSQEWAYSYRYFDMVKEINTYVKC